MRISDWSSDVCSSDLPELRSYRSMTFHALRVIAAIVVFAISPLVITLTVSISSVFAYALFVWMHFRWTTPGILLDFSEAFCFALADTLRFFAWYLLDE